MQGVIGGGACRAWAEIGTEDLIPGCAAWAPDLPLAASILLGPRLTEAGSAVFD
jgi:hypothetical protein